jgi:hypothetical protein
MDTRKTLNTFAGPWAVVSIVVTAYLPPGHPRNITDRGYGGADDLPQSAVIVDVRTLFSVANAASRCTKCGSSLSFRELGLTGAKWRSAGIQPGRGESHPTNGQ